MKKNIKQKKLDQMLDEIKEKGYKAITETIAEVKTQAKPWHWVDSKNIEGLILCYTMAVPFFGYSIAGDLFFGYLFKFSFGKITSILPSRIN